MKTSRKSNFSGEIGIFHLNVKQNSAKKFALLDFSVVSKIFEKLDHLFDHLQK